jgi:hypothetical protein
MEEHHTFPASAPTLPAQPSEFGLRTIIMGTLVMNTLARLPYPDFWLNVSASFLGSLLNRLPHDLLPPEAQSGFLSFGIRPLVSVHGARCALVVGRDARAQGTRTLAALDQ